MRITGSLVLGVVGCLLVATSTCRRSGTQVKVRIHSPRPPALAVSSHWNLPSSPLKSVQAEAGRYGSEIGRDQMPLPFLDLNGNGRLDIEREPTGRCRKESAWQCEIRTERISVHRVQGMGEDSTMVFGDVFNRQTLLRDTAGKLCLTDERRCVDGTQKPPYINAAPALTMKLCDLTNAQKDKEYNIELRSGEKPIIRSRVKQPPPMDLKTRVEKTGDGFIVTGTTSLPISRVVVWSAKVEKGATKSIHWSSEQSPGLLSVRDKSFEMRLPRGVLKSCADCSMGVQVVSDLQLGATSVSSEGVEVLMSLRSES